MIRRKIWRVRQADPTIKYILRHGLGISGVLAGLLANRGVATVGEARLFLEGSLGQMYDPYEMADMDKAVRRLWQSLDRGEKILVYGDYDADGTTATALLVSVIKSLGGKVGYYVPHRVEEGYGLHLEALRSASREGYRLVVTVDCGISSRDEIASNNVSGGPDIIITDHHEPPEILPEALAVINPKRSDCPYRFKELAGVGVALKLAQALLRDAGERSGDWVNYLDLACLGTVADIVPLTGENRIIVKHGLPAIAGTRSPGIEALIKVAGVKPESLGTREVGFALAPRLNAAGRIGDASLAVDLFLTTDPLEAADLAGKLDRGNQERQRIESMVLAEAMGMLDADPGLTAGKVIVLASEGWHSGVVGIVASRLVDKFYRPVLMVALEGGQGKGSGRSVPGFHLYEALSSCKGHLVRFGGHAQAAGFTINAENVEELRIALNRYADANVDESVFTPGIDLDAIVSLNEVTDSFIRELQLMAPFGHCNPWPLLACRGAGLVSFREIGKNGGHLKMVLRENGTLMDGIAFKMASCAGEIAAAAEVDVAFVPSFNEWKGRRSIQLEVKDIRPSENEWHMCVEEGFESKINGVADFFRSAVESLKRLGPLAGVPEFIPGALKSYCEVSPNFVFPGEYLQFYSPKNTCPDSYRASADIPVLPGGRDKIDSLLHLSVQGERVLVLVNTPSHSVEIAMLLSRSGVPAAFLHAGVLPGQAGRIEEAFSAGLAQAVVCTYESLCLLSIRPGAAVLYDVPYSPAGLDLIKGEGVPLYRLFGEEEICVGLEYLESLAPGRDRLADLYSCLPKSKGGGLLDPEVAAGMLRERGLARAGLSTIAFGLSVFADLELLSHRLENGRYLFSRARVSSKKDINQSAVFRAGQEIITSTGGWLERLRLSLGGNC